VRKYLIASLLLISLLLIPNAWAVEETEVKSKMFNSGETITLEKGVDHRGFYFASGDKIVIDGDIDGDTFLAGGRVIVNGNINGDLFIGAGQVDIKGNVNGGVRVGAGTVTISGNVSGSLISGAGTIEIKESANIGRGALLGSGDIIVAGRIAKDLVVGAERLNIDSSIGKDVYIEVTKLSLGNDAKVAGNFTYRSKTKQITENDKIKISGSTKRLRPTISESDYRRFKAPGEEALGAFASYTFLRILGSLLAAFVTGLAVIYLLPKRTRSVLNIVTRNASSSFIYGFFVLIGIPVLAVLLMVTVAGIPLGFISLFLYAVSLMISKTFISLFVGKNILPNQKNEILVFLLGVTIVTIATKLPFVGPLISFLALTIGLGAMTLSYKKTLK